MCENRETQTMVISHLFPFSTPSLPFLFPLQKGFPQESAYNIPNRQDLRNPQPESCSELWRILPAFSGWRKMRTYGCGSKKWYQNGTLVNGTKHQNPCNPSSLILSYTHMFTEIDSLYNQEDSSYKPGEIKYGSPHPENWERAREMKGALNPRG